MDRLTNGPRSRAVVCHGNPLVCEDLRQLLLSKGAGDVVVIHRLDKAHIGNDAVAFIEGSADLLLETSQVQGWLRSGTPVVAMNGGTRTEGLPRGIHVIEQPFRSEDVLEILSRLKVF